jgi:hypothetical protein
VLGLSVRKQEELQCQLRDYPEGQGNHARRLSPKENEFYYSGEGEKRIMKKPKVELCEKLAGTGSCNDCPLVNHPNSRMLTRIFNELYEKYGQGVWEIVESNCPNLTCCYDCHIDDFCHVEGCEIIGE